jgi:hypothetical protein
MARGQYFTEYGGARVDLFDLFESGYVPGQGITGFWDQDGIDLAGYFQPLSNGSSCGFNTGFRAQDGRDISDWFAARGTVAPSGNWPVGGGFVIGNTGQERFVTPTVTALSGRLTWQYQNLNGVRSDSAYGQNLIADRNNLCPGLPTQNAQYWQDEGGFVRASTYGLPRTAVLRFELFTDNVAGSVSREVTVSETTEYAPGWNTIHSGGVPLCSNTPPYLEDPMNVFDFSPPAGQYFGQYAPYIYWSSPNYWAVRVAAMFSCEKNSGQLNNVRLRVRRVS